MAKIDSVRVTNQPAGIFTKIGAILIVFQLFYSCEADICKGTENGLQCLAKTYKVLEDDFKKGYNVKEPKK